MQATAWTHKPAWLTENNQLIRANSISPFKVTKVIDTFTTDGMFVVKSGNSVAVVTVEDKNNPSYMARF
jgi:hypothetical protein